jgi:hypothetical protein
MSYGRQRRLLYSSSILMVINTDNVSEEVHYKLPHHNSSACQSAVNNKMNFNKQHMATGNSLYKTYS